MRIVRLLPVFLSLIGMLLSGTAHAQDTVLSCQRDARTVTVGKAPITVYAAQNEWAQVLFPQRLTGFLPEVPKGISIHGIKNKNRLFIQVDNDFYAGMVYAIGANGQSYNLRILARKDCADSTVKLVPPSHQQSTSSNSQFVRKSGMTLIDYLYLGKVPNGFIKHIVKGAPNQRLVFKQGSVYGYVEQVWKGQGKTGFVIKLINYGRTPVRVNISGINYDAPVMRKVFGRVTGVTMMPRNFTLGPAPEYASQQTHPVNEGLLLISSRKNSQ